MRAGLASLAAPAVLLLADAVAASPRAIESTPGFVATRDLGAPVLVLARFAGAFAQRELIALAGNGAAFRLQSSAGTFVAAHEAAGEEQAPVDAVVAGSELWVLDASAPALHVHALPGLERVRSHRHEALVRPVALAVAPLASDRRDVYVLDAGDGLKLIHLTFETRRGPPGEAVAPAQVTTAKEQALPVPAGPGRLVWDAERGELVVFAAGKIAVFDRDLKELRAFGDPAYTGEILSAGLLSCPSNFDKGYWLLAARDGDRLRMQLHHREDFAPRADFALAGPTPTAVLFSPEAEALFPSGTLVLAQGDTVSAHDWGAIAPQLGVRAACF